MRFGVANPGGADLIGFRSITITPDMVGQQVAVFAALEIKTTSGRIRPEQSAFIDIVKRAGGIAEVVRSVAQAESLLTL